MGYLLALGSRRITFSLGYGLFVCLFIVWASNPVVVLPFGPFSPRFRYSFWTYVQDDGLCPSDVKVWEGELLRCGVSHLRFIFEFYI